MSEISQLGREEIRNNMVQELISMKMEEPKQYITDLIITNLIFKSHDGLFCLFAKKFCLLSFSVFIVLNNGETKNI